MKERFLEVSSDADEKQEQQFETWLSGKGIPFISAEAEEAYKARVLLIKDAGLRGQVKIMVGGSTVDEKVRTYTGADAYGTDAVAAVNLSKKWAAQKSSE
jgi:hypothetical protein